MPDETPEGIVSRALREHILNRLDETTIAPFPPSDDGALWFVEDWRGVIHVATNGGDLYFEVRLVPVPEPRV